jgi:hypothetical protein
MRKNKKIYFLFHGVFYTAVISFFIFFTFQSCKKENLCDCFKSTGKETTISRDIKGFDRVTVNDNLDVYLSEGTEFSVKVTGGKNLVNLVKTVVKDGTLEITNDNKCNFVRTYKRRLKIYVTLPKLSEVTHRGVGTIYSENTFTTDSVIYHVFNSGDLHLKVDNLFLLGGINGMGDFYGSGKTKKHLLNVNGESWMHCEDLETETTDVVAKSSGWMYFKVSTELRAILKAAGNVYYNGSPAAQYVEITGTGKLIQGY